MENRVVRCITILERCFGHYPSRSRTCKYCPLNDEGPIGRTEICQDWGIHLYSDGEIFWGVIGPHVEQVLERSTRGLSDRYPGVRVSGDPEGVDTDAKT